MAIAYVNDQIITSYLFLVGFDFLSIYMLPILVDILFYYFFNILKYHLKFVLNPNKKIKKKLLSMYVIYNCTNN